MIVLGPDTTSPPAKMPARPVASVPGSATMPAQPLTSMPAPFGQDRWIGFLADRDEDGRGRRAPPRCRGLVPSVLGSLPSGRAARRAGCDAADRHEAAVAAHDLDRSESGPDDDPFALGGFDLLDLRGHLSSAASIDDGHWGGAAAPGGTRRIHRRAPPADDDGRTAQTRVLAEVDLLEEDRRGHDPGSSSPGMPSRRLFEAPVDRKTAR